jgi:hypothetical protein
MFMVAVTVTVAVIFMVMVNKFGALGLVPDPELKILEGLELLRTLYQKYKSDYQKGKYRDALSLSNEEREREK